jgi:tetratricopeptide (TPR) repeat protein
MRFAAGDHAGARAAWLRSLEHRPSAWALRNLGALARLEDRLSEAVSWYRRAIALLPELQPLVCEYCQAMLEAGEAEAALQYIAGMPAALRDQGRIIAFAIHAHIETGEFARAETMLREETIITDLREGERSLTDLWFRLHLLRIAEREGVMPDEALRERVEREYPPPAHLDFRMAVQAAAERPCASSTPSATAD